MNLNLNDLVGFVAGFIIGFIIFQILVATLT